MPFFALSDADRASELRANPEAIAAAAASPDAVLLPLSGTKVWVFPEHPNTEPSSVSSHIRWRPVEALVRDVPEDALDRGALSFLGFRARDGAAVFCADVASAPATEAAVRSAVRRREGDDETSGSTSITIADAKSVGPSMRRADAGLLAAAAGLARWQKSVRFCSECGSRTGLVKAGHKASCLDESKKKCRGAFYPKLMPAVLTLCTCGEYALLARNSKWPRGFYSCLAGFVDQSESLEQAVAREVLEESGIRIDDKRTNYVASQPWPFPCQLMVGFETEASAKRVALPPLANSRENVFSYPPTPNLDIHELRDARWFHREWLMEELGKNLSDPREGGGEIPLGSVAVPGAHALARHMLERWVFEGSLGSGGGSAVDGFGVNESTTRKSVNGSSSGSIAAVGLGGGAPAPRHPATNRSHAFVCVDFVGAGGGTRTVLRMQPTGGGGAPTDNDHARLLADVEREAAKRSSARRPSLSSDDNDKDAQRLETKTSESFRVLGGGQLCFRGGEVSENAAYDDEREACLTIVLRNGGGGEAGGVSVAAAQTEVVAALLRRAYPMHDVLVPGREGASGEYQY